MTMRIPRTLPWALIVACTACSSAPTGPTPVDDATDASSIRFESEGVQMTGTLWLPEGEGPFPLIVFVHGSGERTRHDARFTANHYNSRGVAVFGYDKRGVGESGGKYVGSGNTSEENLTLLARDAVAAMRIVRSRADIDGTRSGFLGVSQAGWIVPIAANSLPDVAFNVLVVGPTVTTGEEEVYSDLTEGSYAKRLTLDSDELSRRLAEEGKSGFDPRPFLEQMDMPSLWLLGEMDESIPTPETVAVLDALIAQGRPFHYRVWPQVGHSLSTGNGPVPEYWETQEEFLANEVGLEVR